MTAWAYCLAYNEALLLRYWVRHYKTFCDRVIVYLDVDTTDDSRQIATMFGAEVRTYQGNGALDDIAFIEFAQSHYPEARGRADWVIWADADEILYHPRMSIRLDELARREINVPAVVGYDMFSNHPPAGYGQIYEEIDSGIESQAYGKVCIFDPSLDVRWAAGKHTAAISEPHMRGGTDDPLKLLHYRWLGEEYFLARNARNFSRINAENIERRHGIETYPGYEGVYGPKWYAEQADKARYCL